MAPGLLCRSVLITIFLLPTVRSEGCRVSLTALSLRPPLLLRPDASSFAMPNANGVVSFRPGDSLVLACPGEGNRLLVGHNSTGTSQMCAECVGGQLLVRGLGSSATEPGAWRCRHWAQRAAEVQRTRRCGASARGTRVRLGFRFRSAFLETVGVCFDLEALTPLYATHTLVSAIAGKRPGGERAEFRTGQLYGVVSPRRQYDLQNSTLSQLLGEPWNRNDSLTRGHLASRGSFVFWPQKRATFFYVNAAPQWQSINAGAWAAVERSARNLAAVRGVDMMVVTGVSGVASLNDASGIPTPLYLYVKGPNRKMPVPAVFWKVLYDPRSGEAAAIVVKNAPYQWSPLHTSELRVCQGSCASLRWLQLPRNFKSLVSCCSVDALRRRINDAPVLDVRGLLDSFYSVRGTGEKREMGSPKVFGWEELMAMEEAIKKQGTTMPNKTTIFNLREEAEEEIQPNEQQFFESNGENSSVEGYEWRDKMGESYGTTEVPITAYSGAKENDEINDVRLTGWEALLALDRASITHESNQNISVANLETRNSAIDLQYNNTRLLQPKRADSVESQNERIDVQNKTSLSYESTEGIMRREATGGVSDLSSLLALDEGSSRINSSYIGSK